jgi:hypothetical protein
MISTYFNKNVLESNDYIDNLVSNYKYIDNLESKINIQEDDYNVNIDEINSIDLQKIKDTFQNKKCLYILQKELLIIKLLSKYALQTNNLDNDFVIKCLKLCFELSEILRQKINQKQIKITNKKNIQRCSYKFCNFKENCNYNYSKKKNNYCYQDHYVHNMVSHDLLVLLYYIQDEEYQNINKNESLKEILKSINTISFVINHMESELKAKCLYQDENDWDSFHICNHYKKKNKNNL